MKKDKLYHFAVSLLLSTVFAWGLYSAYDNAPLAMIVAYFTVRAIGIVKEAIDSTTDAQGKPRGDADTWDIHANDLGNITGLLAFFSTVYLW